MACQATILDRFSYARAVQSDLHNELARRVVHVLLLMHKFSNQALKRQGMHGALAVKHDPYLEQPVLGFMNIVFEPRQLGAPVN